METLQRNETNGTNRTNALGFSRWCDWRFAHNRAPIFAAGFGDLTVGNIVVEFGPLVLGRGGRTKRFDRFLYVGGGADL